MEGVSSQQRETLLQFKARIADLIRPEHEDQYLIKWLIARKFDLKKAEQMFRESMAWRQKYGADDLLSNWEVPEVLKLYYPGGVCGYDKHDRPIVIDPIGKIDFRGIMYSVKDEDILRYNIYRIEQTYKLLKEHSKKLGKSVNRVVQIIDFDGFGQNLLWKPALDLFLRLVYLLDQNYPETLAKTFIINTPTLFPMVFNMMKPFLNDETVKKFVLLGRNWMTRVRQDIDPDQLPVHWGGTKSDGDGDVYLASQVGRVGEQVPVEKYMKLEHILPKGSKFQTATLSRKGEADYPITVEKPFTGLRYYFSSDDVIKFGIFMEQDGEKKPVPIEPLQTIHSDRVPHDGLFVFEKPGKYFLLFQNPSVLNKRKLNYYVKVHEDSYSLINIQTNNTNMMQQPVTTKEILEPIARVIRL